MDVHEVANRNRLVVVLAIALGAIVIAGGWLLTARRSARHGEAPLADDPAATAPPASAPPPAVVREERRPAAPAPAEPEHVAADGMGFMPLHDGDPIPPGPVHPHPISPGHQRIFAENRIAFALDDATDARDVAAMKQLLARYRREFPEDQWQLQDGYAVIIDCLEHPGPASRRAAERWLDQNNGSTVKRSVLRDCLEPQQP